MRDKHLPIGTIVYLPHSPDIPGKVVAHVGKRTFINSKNQSIVDFFVRVKWAKAQDGVEASEVPETGIKLFSDLVQSYQMTYDKYVRLYQTAQNL
jgi:hypothetical protein